MGLASFAANLGWESRLARIWLRRGEKEHAESLSFGALKPPFIGASAERSRASVQHKTGSAGLRFGFELGADGKMLVPNPAERRILELMHQLWNAGRSFRAIARELQGRGIAAKEGTVWTHTSPWPRSCDGLRECGSISRKLKCLRQPQPSYDP